MIAQKNRYHRRNHVKYVYKKGRTIRGQHVSITYVSGQKHAAYRAGVVVSRKVNKRAVVRNRIRRRLYEIIRIRENSIPADVDIIITVYNDAVADLPSTELLEVVSTMFTKIKSNV